MSIRFTGKEFTFTQPDGTKLEVRGWGNQHYARFETKDGYTVVKDPVTGFYEYARATPERDALWPSGIAPGDADPKALGLKLGERLAPQAAKARARDAEEGLPHGGSRWEARRQQAKMSIMRAAAIAEARPGPGAPMPAPPQRQTVGDYTGLCLLIQFPDVPGTITRDDVDAFCNQVNYNANGNNGSVRDFFLDSSGGKLRYNNVVAPYYTATHPRSYYTNPNVAQPRRARELVTEALTWLKSQHFDFSALTADDEDYVYATNVFYAGNVVNRWAEGLWPHAHYLAAPYPLMAGKNAHDYQITNMGSVLTVGTFCHENGHMICDFPDLYDYGDQSSGIGDYCLMCGGNNADPRNPVDVGAYLKYRAGWAGSVTPISAGTHVTAHAGKNEFFIHSKSITEYYIIENRAKSGRDKALPDSGLAVWHIDERGNQEHEHMTVTQHYECSLVQADGRFDLERTRGASGDDGDLFDGGAGGVSEFSPSTTPNSNWWDGTSSKLTLKNISQVGPVMTFDADL
jgi:M6 family metalloprotease-like protein